jgi:hypothetical protein
MRIVPMVITFALLAFVSAALPAGCDQTWRLGGSFDYLTSGGAKNLLGNTWNVGAEYDFTDMVPEDDAMGGHISMAVYYRQFDNLSGTTDFKTSYTSFGLRWRGGAGADPGTQGLYGGIGVAAALLSIRPSFDTLTPHKSFTKLEVGAFVGVNVGRYLFLEVGYNNLNPVDSFNLSNAMFTFGVRL